MDLLKPFYHILFTFWSLGFRYENIWLDWLQKFLSRCVITLLVPKLLPYLTSLIILSDILLYSLSKERKLCRIRITKNNNPLFKEAQHNSTQPNKTKCKMNHRNTFIQQFFIVLVDCYIEALLVPYEKLYLSLSVIFVWVKPQTRRRPKATENR